MEEPGETCKLCDKSVNLKRCGRCKTVLYCSREHQIQDWSSHKVTCGRKEVIKNDNRHEKFSEKVPTTNKSDRDTSSVVTNETIKRDPEHTEPEFDERELNCITVGKPKKRDMFSLSQFAYSCLNRDGFCIIDGLLPQNKCTQILNEVKSMEKLGLLKTGKLAGGDTSGIEEQKVVNTSIRSDKMFWLNGTETEDYPRICDLIENTMDVIVGGLNAFSNGEFVLQGKTKAMVACYPGNGTAYKRHVDNPSGDGRLVTCIMYLNENWDCKKQGGNLRVFPTCNEGSYADIEPKMNRLFLFWSDHRTPHEVQPSYDTRYAVTIWYFDQKERDQAKKTAQLNKDLAQVHQEISMLELKKMQTEKMVLEQKIENEAAKAVQALSEDEMQALCAMVSERDNPREVLQQLGISKSIQEHLLKEINLRLAKT